MPKCHLAGSSWVMGDRGGVRVTLQCQTLSVPLPAPALGLSIVQRGTSTRSGSGQGPPEERDGPSHFPFPGITAKAQAGVPPRSGRGPVPGR